MGRKLMVVAHPDDETIFGGAHLFQRGNWTVVCVTNGRNKRRANEFKRAMRLVGVNYEIWNYRDKYSPKMNQGALKRDLKKLLERVSFEQVVTHGLSGEYGHPQHKIISKIMHQLVRRNLYVFGISNRKLPPSILNKKRKLLRNYRSQMKNIRELCRDDHLYWYIERECFQRIR